MIAKRRFGQNFLVDPTYQRRIVAALGAIANQTVVEIGPGHGALTRWLVEAGANVIAVETDRDLIPRLAASFGTKPGFRLIEADALEVDFSQFASGSRIPVIGNLPYNISTPLIQHLVDSRESISELVVMLQREVVDRMTAVPGGKEYGYLSVLTQIYCETERLFDVPPGAFRPAPKVVSSVVRLRVSLNSRVPVADERLFVRVAQVIFAQRRKTLLNNLKAGSGRVGLVPFAAFEGELSAGNIDLRRRAETLTLLEIAQLTDFIGLVKRDGGSRPGR